MISREREKGRALPWEKANVSACFLRYDETHNNRGHTQTLLLPPYLPPPLHLKENKMRKLKNLYYSASPGERVSHLVFGVVAPYTFLP
jgi:hypothetical protein